MLVSSKTAVSSNIVSLRIYVESLSSEVAVSSSGPTNDDHSLETVAFGRNTSVPLSILNDAVIQKPPALVVHVHVGDFAPGEPASRMSPA